MPELRKDPILGDWVILAPVRASRPFDHQENGSTSPPDVCPFCKGNESATPEAVMCVLSRDSPEDWAVRITPNLYPAVTDPIEGTDHPELSKEASTVACGYHEVIIESPSHHIAMNELSEQQFVNVVRAWRDRLAVVCHDPSVAHTMLFKNEGAAAGASLEHVHSQLLATSFVPAKMEAKLDAGLRHFEQTGKPVWTELLERELADGSRIVNESEDFVLLCPFSSRFPGEMCLLPRVHSPGFETLPDTDLPSLAARLWDAIVKLDQVFPSAAFNLGLYTAPPRDCRRPHFHWHLAITPRLTGIAGYEVGAGSWINIVTPEDAAERYRTCSRQVSPGKKLPGRAHATPE